MKLAGHCQQTGAGWTNTQALVKRTFLIHICRAGALSTKELANCAENRDDWKRRWKARLRMSQSVYVAEWAFYSTLSALWWVCLHVCHAKFAKQEESWHQRRSDIANAQPLSPNFPNAANAKQKKKEGKHKANPSPFKLRKSVWEEQSLSQGSCSPAFLRNFFLCPFSPVAVFSGKM